MPYPCVIIPGYFAQSREYLDLNNSLNQQGILSTVVPLKKKDWWPTLGGRSVATIIERIDATVKDLQEQSQTTYVNLIGHSAGGWIARIYMGEKPYDGHLWKAHEYVANLVTLGTPHTSYEPWTRKNIDFVNDNYPGAFYPKVNYICVAGKSIYGKRTFTNWLAYNSYQLTCGLGSCWGDGITPITAAHLSGAINLTLEDVLHAPSSQKIWYGSPEVRVAWTKYL